MCIRDRYDGKTVRFLAQAYVGKDVPAGSFVPGRFGMVCCADDVTFLGFLCRYPDRDQLHNRDWVKVTAVSYTPLDGVLRLCGRVCQMELAVCRPHEG